MPHFIYINTPDASQATYFSHFVPLSVLWTDDENTSHFEQQAVVITEL